MSLHLMIYMNCNDPTKDPDLNELWGFSCIGPIMLTIFQEQAYQIKYFRLLARRMQHNICKIACLVIDFRLK